MSIRFLFRRGTTAQNDAFTGPEGYVTIDTERKELRIHDGVTPGGAVIAQKTKLWMGTRGEYDAITTKRQDVLYIVRPVSTDPVIDLSDPISSDTTPPTVPGNFRTLSTGAYSVTLTWDASTDNIGVVGYEISVDGGAVIQLGNVTQYTLGNLNPETTYSLRARAFDGAGNRSSWCTAILVTTSTLNTIPNTYKLLTFDVVNDGDPDYIYTTLNDAYLGAYRLQEGGNAAGTTYDAAGSMAYNPDNDSLFLAGHWTELCIAEYDIPTIVDSTTIGALNTAPRLQNYISLRDKRAIVDEGSGFFISGMHYHNSSLLINTVRIYNQGFSYPNNSLILNNANDLANTTASNWLPLEGSMRASGWVSPIPTYLQETVGATHLCGMATSTFLALEHDSSNGPSFWGIDANTVLNNKDTVTQIETIYHWDYYPYTNAIGGLDANDGRYNVAPRFPSHENKLWTFLSRVTCGFVIPGTRTFAAFGGSGGHRDGLAYYAPVWGNQGHNSLTQYDNDVYYWLFDLNVILGLKNGTVQPEDVMPYEYGPITTSVPFQLAGAGGVTPTADSRIITGGFIRGNTNEIHLGIARADTENGGFDAPIIAVYKFVNDAGGVIVPQIIDLSLWSDGLDGKVRGNDPTGTEGTPVGDLPLYTLDTPGVGEIGGAPTYEGAFIPTDGGLIGDIEGACWDDTCAIGIGSTNDRIFLTGKQQSSNSGPAIAEVTIPTLVAGSDINALNMGVVTQPFKIHTGVQTAHSANPRILNISTLNGQVILGAVDWYDTGGAPQNYAVFEDAGNLNTGGMTGMFNATGGRHNAGWVLEIPPEFQGPDKLNATHLSGMGGGVSIISTTVAGISFYSLNANDILNATVANTSIPAVALCDHNENNGNGMAGPLNSSPMWNFLSRCAAAFFIPNTRTIMCVGSNWGGATSIIYKQNNELGVYTDGYQAYGVNDYRNYVWLFDVNDLIAVAQGQAMPSSVLPYWHGVLPDFPFANRNYGSSLIGGAFMHPVTKRIYFSYQRGATGRFTASPTVGRFRLAAI